MRLIMPEGYVSTVWGKLKVVAKDKGQTVKEDNLETVYSNCVLTLSGDITIDTIKETIDTIIEQYGIPDWEFYQINEEMVYIGSKYTDYKGYFCGADKDRKAEETLRIDVEKFVRGTTQFPIYIDWNNRNNDFHALTPAVFLTPARSWSNNGDGGANDEIMALSFDGNVAVVDMPLYFAGRRHYWFSNYVTFNNEWIETPIGVLFKNRNGWGNSLIITNATYRTPQDGSPIASIFAMLKKPKFWQKVIYPMISGDFEEIKSKFETAEVPLSMRIKMFKKQRLGLLDKEIKELETKRDYARNEIETYIKEITKRKILSASMETDILDKKKQLRRGMNSKTVDAEIAQLFELPFLKNVSFNNGDITLEFTELAINVDGPVLGPYIINYHKGRNEMTITNEGNPVSGRAHPHCENGGYPCLGNYSDVYFHLANGEIYAAAIIIHKYLTTYNPEDCWGDYLRLWDAKWWLTDLEQRGFTSRVHEFARLYFDTFGRYPSDCERCTYCNKLIEYCECQMCSACGSIMDDCECERCPECNALPMDCTCNV